MAQVVTAEEAVAKIPDGATVLVNPLPIEEVFPAFARCYERAGTPRDLTVVWAAGIGPFSEAPRGMNHFAVPGMVKRIVAGHIGLNYRLVKMVAANQCEAYNLPQGVMTQLYREIAAKRPGLLSRVGLGTFVDPRDGGGKMNERTADCEDLVQLVEVDGCEFLLYKAFPVDVGIVRGTSADPVGNIRCDDEALRMENLEVAIAAKSRGGFVIAQVAEVYSEPFRPHSVDIPGLFVDYLVKPESPKAHPHTLFVQYDPDLSGSRTGSVKPEIDRLPLTAEKVICRRAVMEMEPGDVVNLGVGIPMGVASVAHEEGVLHHATLTTEVGVIGGVPEGGHNFGPAKNPEAFISQAAMFDFYDGGGLDLACVGAAQIDRQGSVNVSKLGPKLIGCGGFINITQSARKCVFCGEFTARGLETRASEGALQIVQEGGIRKFVESVEQVTFSGPIARQGGQRVLYVTERCVFELVKEGLKLAEVAPGIDVERDIAGQMEFAPIIPGDVPRMDERLFRDAPMGLAHA